MGCRDAVDFKVFSTEKGRALYLDMFVMGNKKTKVRRRMFPEGHLIVEGLVAFQEIKLDDVSRHAG